MSILRWFSWRERRAEEAPEEEQEEEPPRLPFRCGTMLMRSGADPQANAATVAAWRAAEDRYREWVAAHSDPKAEWLEKVKFLRQRRRLEEAVNSAFGSDRGSEKISQGFLKPRRSHDPGSSKL